MSKVMIIGCGGVASVAIHKCCQNSEVFSEIMIASRTLSKCDALKEKLAPTTKTIITTAKVDADCTEELIALIKQYQPDAVLNLALPYQDLTIMDACLACKVPYIDTANYEAENTDDPATRSPSERIPPALPQHRPHPGCVIMAPASASVSRMPILLACR